jgi:hypothetical protein
METLANDLVVQAFRAKVRGQALPAPDAEDTTDSVVMLTPASCAWRIQECKGVRSARCGPWAIDAVRFRDDLEEAGPGERRQTAESEDAHGPVMTIVRVFYDGANTKLVGMATVRTHGYSVDFPEDVGGGARPRAPVDVTRPITDEITTFFRMICD